MRITLFIVLISTSLSWAQRVKQESFETLLTKGKAEFKKEFDQQDFSAAVNYLKKAVTLQPENAEAHYFLGYAYSRLNAKDGKNMINMDLKLNILSSEEFEQVIQLTPKYTGEIVVLDPYSKITSEWGSMAMCYYNNNKLDSAVWAFNEGKRRGGFGNFYLAVNKYMLSHCSKNSILMCSGDNLTIPLWYLQLVENYRTDVTVVSIDLLNTSWYPKFLRSKYHVTFDQPEAAIDTLDDVVVSKDSLVYVRNKYAYKDFTWTVEKTEKRTYWSRSERLFLSILKANEFESDVFFTSGFNEALMLDLNKHLLPMVLLDQLNVSGKRMQDFSAYKTQLTEALELTKTVNLNSADEAFLVEAMRYDIALYLDEQHQLHHEAEVKQLFRLMDKYLPEKKFPYESKELKNYVNYLRKQY